MGPGFFQAALAGAAPDRVGPYGCLLAVDAHGLQLPAGFHARVVAVSGEPVGDSAYVWGRAPGGAACLRSHDGGWVLAVNAEGNPGGGAGALRCDRDGAVVDAYRVLDGTRCNHAGVATPWGTWLSCERTKSGLVFECDVTRGSQGTARPAMGAFAHAAVTVDPVRGRLYLAEDGPSGHYYRFTPTTYPDLSAGTLEAARLLPDGAVVWLPVPDPQLPASAQVAAATTFNGCEGIHHDRTQAAWIFFTTTGDHVLWAHDLHNDVITPLGQGARPVAALDTAVAALSGDLFIGADDGNPGLTVVAADTRAVTPFLRLPGAAHAGSRITGPCFSPDGTRLYFSSRPGGRDASAKDVTFEVTGPFRTQRVDLAVIATEDVAQPVGV